MQIALEYKFLEFYCYNNIFMLKGKKTTSFLEEENNFEFMFENSKNIE